METKCPQCGAARPPDEEWVQDLCPTCLMKLGLSGAIPAIEPHPEPREKPAPASSGRSRSGTWSWRWPAIFATAAAALVLIVITANHLLERPEPRQVVQFAIDLSEEMELQDFAVSPDGRTLAYTATAGDGEIQLYLR